MRVRAWPGLRAGTGSDPDRPQRGAVAGNG